MKKNLILLLVLLLPVLPARAGKIVTDSFCFSFLPEFCVYLCNGSASMTQQRAYHAHLHTLLKCCNGP